MLCIVAMSEMSYGIDNKFWFEYHTAWCKVGIMLVWGGFPLSILLTLCKTEKAMPWCRQLRTDFLLWNPGVQSWVSTYEICCGKSVIGPGLSLNFFRFPLLIIILSLLQTDLSLCSLRYVMAIDQAVHITTTDFGIYFWLSMWLVMDFG